ncbi:MAG: GIY-YIG nuclease family protein [Synechococcales bacterium]|nr:GIY-YIG nuclease family protein [Synechococcales bacterium]
MASSPSSIPTLQVLERLPYIDDQGHLPEHLSGTVGVYAIFSQDQTLQYVGYSRNVLLSLQQHLIRQPQSCHWVKVHTIERPQRSVLEEIRDTWLAENGTTPAGNGAAESDWTQPIDATQQMTPDERVAYEAAATEGERAKALKTVARRVEGAIATQLKERGLADPIRFDPKLKDQGLLNVKP